MVCKAERSGQTLDILITVGLGVAMIPFILANILILFYRSYLPIKAKSVDLTVFSSIGGFIWIFATLVVNGHFERDRGTFWTLCFLWTFWLQLCFGFSLWVTCLNVRLINLSRIFLQKKDPIRWIVRPLFLQLVPAITFCGLATYYGASKFHYRDPGTCKPPTDSPPPGSACTPADGATGDCLISNRLWAVGALLLLPAYFCVFLWHSFQLRNIMAQYNEYRVLWTGGALSLFLFLLSIVTIQTQAYLEVTGRCLLTTSVAFAVFYYFWARMSGVVYDVLFRREESLTNFLENLRRYSVAQEGEEDPRPHADTTPLPDRAMGGVQVEALEFLLTQARAEAGAYKRRVTELEDTNHELKERCHALEAEVTSVQNGERPATVHHRSHHL